MLLVGLLLRLVAALFSRGYAFTDDHYFVIEEAQQWIFQGPYPSSFWHPWVNGEGRLSHSSLYTSIHYALFQFYRNIGLENPSYIMLTVRMGHAFYSLLIVYFGFLLVKSQSDFKKAKQAAWILTLAWFMPFLSVRNLVEMVCIPPLMASAWLIQTPKWGRKGLFLAGILASLAFALRFQTALFSGMFGVVLLFQGNWKKALNLAYGFIFGSLIFLGLLDYGLFGMPFHELISYIDYNITHSGEYPNGPWYQYILLLFALFPLFLGGNWFTALPKALKFWPLITLPFLAFFIFHSYFPNKQERFILPIVPFFVLLGVVYFNQVQNSMKSAKLEKWQRFTSRMFWVLNVILLLPMTLASTRTAKLDAMLFLQKQTDAHSFVIESSHTNYMEYMPRFYGNFWKPYQHILKDCDTRCFFDSVATGYHPEPNYVMFFDTTNLNLRVARFEDLRKLEFCATIESSWLDQLIPKLNPVVKSQQIFIYRVIGTLPTASRTAAVETAAASKSTEPSRTSTTESIAAKSTSPEKNRRSVKSPTGISTTTTATNEDEVD